MNYIKQLQKELVESNEMKEKLFLALNEFRSKLLGSKFTGLDIDGERKDWISTTDVIRWIDDTKQSLWE